MGNGKGSAGHAQPRGNLGGAPVKLEVGPPARLANHFDLKPVHTETDAGSQGLGSRLFGGKPRGKALCGLALAAAIGLLRAGVDAVEKAAP